MGRFGLGGARCGGRDNREPDDELGASAPAGAHRLDAAAMHPHDAAHDAQADAQAPAGSAQDAVDLREHVEDARQRFGRDADAVVGDTHGERPGGLVDAQADVAARVRVLDRVVDQVGEHLGEPHQVPFEVDLALGKLQGELASRGIERGLRRLERARQHLGQRQPLPAQLERAPTDAPEVEQVVDQPHHLPQLPLQDAVRLRQHRRVRGAGEPQRLERGAHGRERVAQLVRERRQELVLVPVGLEQRLLRALELRDVVRAADVADERSVGGHARHAGRVQPAVLAVAAPQADLRVERLARLEGSQVGRQVGFLVVGVDEALPAEAADVFPPAAEEAQVLAVDEVAALEAVDPDQHRRVVGERAEARLALAQRRLEADALRHVDGDASDQARSGGRRYRELADERVVHAVLVLQRLDSLDRGAAGEGARVVSVELGGCGGREDLVVRAAEDVAAKAPEGASGGLVDEQVAAVRVLDPGEARQVVHEPGEAALALFEGRAPAALALPRPCPRESAGDQHADEPDPGAVRIVEGAARVQPGDEHAEPLRAVRLHEPEDGGSFGLRDADHERLGPFESRGEAPGVAGRDGDARRKDGADARARGDCQ